MKITYILLFLIFGINSYGQKFEETKNWTERYVKEAAGEKWRDCNLDTFNISRSDNSPILYFEIDTSFIIHIIQKTIVVILEGVTSVE